MKSPGGMMKDTILITDLGSTTTKAILLSKAQGDWRLVALANAPTTVEKPDENVMAGILTAVEHLQKQTNTVMITPHPVTQEKQINPDITWLSTSSAGGGLQILVIGLTTAESAASAERAAYGVGGVILDTIAIDDGRTTVEQMQAIENRQPDIILLSGGYEGGAYASILRLAETLSYCEIKPKYSLNAKIPVIYAGNSEAVTAIKHILSNGFELHVLPNLRPSDTTENLSPVTQQVHELFLHNVMQQAPGYKAVSEGVSHPVIPTPLGVMNALQIISETDVNASAGQNPTPQTKNILAVDIGGATTDVYSNIFHKFFRTVSANYGMSYNLCNVFANADAKQYPAWLHPDVTEDILHDYIGNKMLNPTYTPASDLALHIEQAMAKIALQLSLQQHLAMNFSIHEIGHFMKLKTDDRDPFHEQFYRDKLDEKLQFGLQDFQQIIGAGGVLSHAPQPKQAAIMLVDGLQPRGITELWSDKHFISPHLGKLGEVDKSAAQSLLRSDCLEALCVCIRPMSNKLKKDKPALRLEITRKETLKTLEINGNSLLWIELSGVSKIKIKAHGSVQIALDISELEYVTELPLLIDTRMPGEYSFAQLNAALQLYPGLPNKASEVISPAEMTAGVNGFVTPAANIIRGTARRTFTLPYTGRIYVSEGDRVQPDKLLGENLYDPPRLYVLQVFRGSEKLYSEAHFRKFLLVKPQDEVKMDQLIYKEELSIMGSLLSTGVNQYYSPVRGRVERIDWANGALLLREIQDYSFEPVVLNIAELLGVKPGLVMGLMRKRIGDFVHTGEVLAAKGKTKMEHSVRTPTTGTIQSYDAHTGKLTIAYIKKDLTLKASLFAIVTKVAGNRFVELEYEGITLDGSIGFGKITSGKLIYQQAWDEAAISETAIMAYPFALTVPQMEVLIQKQVSGLIVPSLPQKEMVKLLGREIGVGITGNEHIPLSIMLLSGFGQLKLPAPIAHELKLNSGKHTVLLPATQIRAGVVRPVLIIQ